LPPAVTTPTPSASNHRSASSSLSLAIPGSILDTASSHEAAASIAGQLARAACVFGADEVVVYDDSPSTSGHWDGTISAGTAALARLLQYIETPPYLRKSLTPQVSSLLLYTVLRQLKDSGWRPVKLCLLSSKNCRTASAPQETVPLAIIVVLCQWKDAGRTSFELCSLQSHGPRLDQFAYLPSFSYSIIPPRLSTCLQLFLLFCVLPKDLQGAVSNFHHVLCLMCTNCQCRARQLQS
jgi:hypothetical protein